MYNFENLDAQILYLTRNRQNIIFDVDLLFSANFAIEFGHLRILCDKQCLISNPASGPDIVHMIELFYMNESFFSLGGRWIVGRIN